MRTALILALTATPAAAWEFSATPICTLTSDTGNVTVTYDARLPEYTITVTLPGAGWEDAPVFGMMFDTPQPITIQTDRHQRSDDGRSITVADAGFGNVLNGLEFGTTATAFTGTSFTNIPLVGIGPAVRAFRACPDDILS